MLLRPSGRLLLNEKDEPKWDEAGPVSKDIGRFETVVKHNQDECVVQHAMLGEVPPDSSCGVCDDDHAKEPVFNDCGEKTIVEFVLVDDFIFAT